MDNFQELVEKFDSRMQAIVDAKRANDIKEAARILGGITNAQEKGLEEYVHMCNEYSTDAVKLVKTTCKHKI